MLSEVLAVTDTALNSVIGNKNHRKDYMEDINRVIQENKEIKASSDGSCQQTNTSTESGAEDSAAPLVNIGYSQYQSTIPCKATDMVKGSNPTANVPCSLPSYFIAEPKDKALLQGQNLSVSDNLFSSSNDVISERYKSGEKQRIFKEKLKPRQDQPRNKRVVRPTIVVEKKATLEKKAESQQASCTAMVTAAVAPFVVIQQTLENQITSLVNTLQNAHIAEKEFITKSSKQKDRSHNTEILQKLNDVCSDMRNMQKYCNEHTTTTSNSASEQQAINVVGKQRPKKDDTTVASSHRALLSKKDTDIQKMESCIIQQKGMLKNHRTESIPQLALLQTPVPRRKPPKPVSTSPKHGRGSVASYDATPKMSNRGLALLQEIMADQSISRENISHKTGLTAKGSSLPPRSHPIPAFIKEASHSPTVEETSTELSSETPPDKYIPLIKEPCYEIERKNTIDDFVTKTDILPKWKVKELDELNDFSLSEECPLDKYLKQNISKDVRKKEDCKNKKASCGDDVKNHALSVLRQTQEAKEKLEQNIYEITRKHKELDFFGYLEEPQTEDEKDALRIKKAISEEIKFIQKEIQESLRNPKRHEKAIEDVKKTTARVPLSQRHLQDTKAKPQEKTLSRVLKQSKMKQKRHKKTASPPPESSTAYDDLIYQHIYGRPPHQPHRHTLRDNDQKQHFCSPTKIRYQQHGGEEHLSKHAENTIPRTLQDQKKGEVNNLLYFHPFMPNLNSNLSYTGNLFPAATQIAKPSQDPAGRLPLMTTEFNQETSLASNVGKLKHLTKTGPNVAVITMKSKDCDEESLVKQRIRLKVRQRLKNKLKLNYQPLPNIDIDTTDPSTTTEPSSFISNQMSPQAFGKSAQGERHLQLPNDVPDDVPEDKSYQFQEFLSVRETKKDDLDVADSNDDLVFDKSNHEEVLSITGCQQSVSTAQAPGPAFPPTHFQHQEAIPQNVPTESTLESKAQELLEQELLARILAGLEIQSSDPTLREVAENASLHDVDNEDEERSSFSWLEHIVGLQGIQLFIDAGIPVDQDLVCQLIRSVILERLEIMFGYPQPSKDVVPAKSLFVMETHEKEERTIISTPCKTPDSSPVSTQVDKIQTPERTFSELTEQSVNDTNESLQVVEPEEKDESYPLIPTPRRSEASETPPPREHVGTPTSSEENTIISQADLNTPDQTLSNTLNELQEEFDSFVPTASSPELAEDTHITPADLEKTPPTTNRPIPLPRSEPSTSSTTSTEITLSTAVGTSTFDCMSVGEHLHPSQVVSGMGSEGEMGRTMAIFEGKTLEDIENQFFPFDHDTQGNEIKEIMRTLVELRSQRRVGGEEGLHSTSNDLNNNATRSEGEILQSSSSKSAGEVLSLSQDDTNEERKSKADEDTLQEISIADRISHVHTQQHKIVKVRPNLTVESSFSEHDVNLQSERSAGEFVWRNGAKIDNAVSNELSGITTNDSKHLLSIGQLVDSVRSHDNRTSPLLSKATEYDVSAEELQHSQSRTRLIVVESNESRVDSEHASDGELASFESLALSANEIEEERKVQMVLKLPLVSDEYEEQDLSQYDMSSLSGGEL